MSKSKSISRVDLHKSICKLIKLKTKTFSGYMSRKEMLELFFHLERMKSAINEILTILQEENGKEKIKEILNDRKLT